MQLTHFTLLLEREIPRTDSVDLFFTSLRKRCISSAKHKIYWKQGVKWAVLSVVFNFIQDLHIRC